MADSANDSPLEARTAARGRPFCFLPSRRHAVVTSFSELLQRSLHCLAAMGVHDVSLRISSYKALDSVTPSS